MSYLQRVLPLIFKNCCTLVPIPVPVPVPVSVSVQLSFGLCISLISRMFSLMENFKRKYTWINPLDMFSEHPIQWLWKVWYGLKQSPRAFFIDLVLFYLGMVSNVLLLNILSLFVTLLLALLFWLFMWMI